WPWVSLNFDRYGHDQENSNRPTTPFLAHKCCSLSRLEEELDRQLDYSLTLFVLGYAEGRIVRLQSVWIKAKVEIVSVKGPQRMVQPVVAVEPELHTLVLGDGKALALVTRQVGAALQLQNARDLPAIDEAAGQLVCGGLWQFDGVGSVEQLLAAIRQHAIVVVHVELIVEADDTHGLAKRVIQIDGVTPP